jgi:hypothetical protein
MVDKYKVISEPSKLKFEEALNKVKASIVSMSNVATTTFKDEECNDCVMYTVVVTIN